MTIALRDQGRGNGDSMFITSSGDRPAPVDAPWRAVDADKLASTSDYIRVEPHKDGFSNNPLLWGVGAGTLAASVHMLDGGAPINGKAMALTGLVVGAIAAGAALLTKLDNGSSRTIEVEGAEGLEVLRRERPDLAAGADEFLERSDWTDAAGVADQLLATFDTDDDGVISTDERRGTSANGHAIELDRGLNDGDAVDRRTLITEVAPEHEIKVDQQGAGDAYVRLDGFTERVAGDFITRR